MVECGGLEMFAASLNKSSQVSFKHAKLRKRFLSRFIVSYSVRKSVRKIGFSHWRGFRLHRRPPIVAAAIRVNIGLMGLGPR